jgi:hypothetical protein
MTREGSRSVSNKTIALIADIGSFIIMRRVLGWGFVLSFLLAIGVYFLTMFALRKMGRAE